MISIIIDITIIIIINSMFINITGIIIIIIISSSSSSSMFIRPGAASALPLEAWRHDAAAERDAPRPSSCTVL